MHWALNLGHPVSWAVAAAIALVAVLAGIGILDLPPEAADALPGRCGTDSQGDGGESQL